MRMSEFDYRSNVAGILRNAHGWILVCERALVEGAWQFPQGGVDEGETLEEALRRELREEIGVMPDDYQIVESRGPYRYLFGGGRMKKGFHGKEQHYFLCDFRAPDSHINVATEHPEFRAWKWIAPENFQIAWLPEMKVEVYRAVFRDFFKITL
jgi:putative (di)nucleoside polyphosphate hydrolase